VPKRKTHPTAKVSEQVFYSVCEIEVTDLKSVLAITLNNLIKRAVFKIFQKYHATVLLGI